jgi:hypothetical protein
MQANGLGRLYLKDENRLTIRGGSIINGILGTGGKRCISGNIPL